MNEQAAFDALMRGETVPLPVGELGVREYPGYVGRDPKNGARVDVAPRRLVCFSPTKAASDALSRGEPLPVPVIFGAVGRFGVSSNASGRPVVTFRSSRALGAALNGQPPPPTIAAPAIEAVLDALPDAELTTTRAFAALDRMRVARRALSDADRDEIECIVGAPLPPLLASLIASFDLSAAIATLGRTIASSVGEFRHACSPPQDLPSDPGFPFAWDTHATWFLCRDHVSDAGEAWVLNERRSTPDVHTHDVALPAWLSVALLLGELNVVGEGAVLAPADAARVTEHALRIAPNASRLFEALPF